MRTAGIREHDVVLVDRRGRRFEAIVGRRDPHGGRFSITPLRPAVSYMTAGAREIVAHWRARPHAAGRVSLPPIRVGDLLQVRLDGAAVFGLVVEKREERLGVRPFSRSARVRDVAAVDVVRHYARRGRRARRSA
jgi:hypothetical protein